MRARSKRSAFVDILLYVAISCVVGGIAIALGVSGMSVRMGDQIMTLLLYTSILFGVFVGFIRNLWVGAKFWALTSIAFMIHATAYGLIIGKDTHWRSAWSAVMFLELPILELLKRAFAKPNWNRKRRVYSGEL